MIAGWVTTEVGRQPWTVYGLLRTVDSVSPSLTGNDVAISLTLYVVVYLIMFLTGIAFMAMIVRRGVDDGSGELDEAEASRPVRAFAGAATPIAAPAGPAEPAATAGVGNGSTDMILDLVPIWTLILGLAVFYYVVFDGFDLGVGILSGFVRTEWRQLMMNSVAPIWDGNETWLVLGGIGLMAAFPLAFAIIIPAVYFPIVVMLLALVFRGVAFEFRFKQRALQALWGFSFCFGSTVATFAQGVVLGAFIQGFKVDGRHFAGGSFDFLTPFAMLTGIALMFGYGLLGAGWLIIKTEGDLQAWSRRAGRICLVGVAIAVLAVSIWTPLVDPEIAQRWFSWPNILLLSPVPVVTAALAALAWYAFGSRFEPLPFLSAIGLFLMSFIGITISLWPMIVPHHYTLWEASSSPSTQAFLLIGTLFLLPVILMYTAWSYWVFRGKVRADIGYH